MKLPKIIITVFLFSLSTFKASAFEGTYELIIKKKQEEKASKRWTLANWLNTKRRMDLMDQWLLLNTDTTFFEFYLDGNVSSMKADSALFYHEDDMNRYRAGLFILPIGFEYTQHTYDPGKNTELMGSLRILGSSLQTTNLIFSYGQIKREDNTLGNVKNNFWQIRSNLYLIDFFGFHGGYQKILANNNDLNTQEIEGRKGFYGFFIELTALRIYMEWFKENHQVTTLGTGATANSINQGLFYGVRLYL